MNTRQKKALYESIMKNVSRQVRKALYESDEDVLTDRMTNRDWKEKVNPAVLKDRNKEIQCEIYTQICQDFAYSHAGEKLDARMWKLLDDKVGAPTNPCEWKAFSDLLRTLTEE